MTIKNLGLILSNGRFFSPREFSETFTDSPIRIRTRKLRSYAEGKDIIRSVCLVGIGPGAWYVVRKIYIVFLRLGRKNRVPVSVFYLIYGVSRGGSRNVIRAYGVRIRQIKSGVDRTRRDWDTYVRDKSSDN